MRKGMAFFIGVLVPVIAVGGVALILVSKPVYGMDLVRDGKPRAAIIVDLMASKVTHFAALEFQGYIEKMSGARLPLLYASRRSTERLEALLSRESEVESAILIGESRFTKELGISGEDLRPDGFRVFTIPEGLVILGRDDPEAAPTSLASGSAGTLYGVYRVLEELGVRWFYPGQIGEVVPNKKDIDIENLEISDAPYFHFRMAYPPIEDEETRIWLRRIGFGADSNPLATTHPFEGWQRRYANEHPEYFALDKGRRTSHIGFPHPGVRERMIQDAREFFLSQESGRHPYFVVMPNDGFLTMCECPECQRRVAKSEGFYGAFSDYVAEAALQVAEAMKEEFPDRAILIGAYATYIRPPLSVRQLPSNVGVVIAKDSRLHFWSQEYKENIHSIIDGWVGMRPKELYFWEYYNFDCQGDRAWLGVPAIASRFITEDIKYLKRLSEERGVKIGGEAIFSDGRAGEHNRDRLWWLCLDYYLTAKLLWNPDLNIDNLLEDFYERFFGPAAGPMRKFFERLEEIWATGDHGGRHTYGAKDVAAELPLPALLDLTWFRADPWESLFPLKVLMELAGYLDAAKIATATDSFYRDRVKYVEEGFRFTARMGKEEKELEGKFGYLDEDIEPASGSLQWQVSGGCALDYNRRSVGLDLGVQKHISTIRLSADKSVYPNRVTRGLDRLSLWFSDDNRTWQRYEGPVEVSEMRMPDGSIRVTFSGLSVRARYIKIHGDFPDTRFEFVASVASKIICAYGEEALIP